MRSVFPAIVVLATTLALHLSHGLQPLPKRSSSVQHSVSRLSEDPSSSPPPRSSFSVELLPTSPCSRSPGFLVAAAAPLPPPKEVTVCTTLYEKRHRRTLHAEYAVRMAALAPNVSSALNISSKIVGYVGAGARNSSAVRDLGRGLLSDAGAECDAIIGPGVSSAAQGVNLLVDTLWVDYSATATVLSDKTSYPFFSRVIPSDDTAASAIAALAKKFAWSNIAALCADDPYGRSVVAGIGKAMGPTPATAQSSSSVSASSTYSSIFAAPASVETSPFENSASPLPSAWVESSLIAMPNATTPATATAASDPTTVQPRNEQNTQHRSDAALQRSMRKASTSSSSSVSMPQQCFPPSATQSDIEAAVLAFLNRQRSRIVAVAAAGTDPLLEAIVNVSMKHKLHERFVFLFADSACSSTTDGAGAAFELPKTAPAVGSTISSSDSQPKMSATVGKNSNLWLHVPGSFCATFEVNVTRSAPFLAQYRSQPSADIATVTQRLSDLGLPPSELDANGTGAFEAFAADAGSFTVRALHAYVQSQRSAGRADSEWSWKSDAAKIIATARGSDTAAAISVPISDAVSSGGDVSAKVAGYTPTQGVAVDGLTGFVDVTNLGERQAVAMVVFNAQPSTSPPPSSTAVSNPSFVAVSYRAQKVGRVAAIGEVPSSNTQDTSVAPPTAAPSLASASAAQVMLTHTVHWAIAGHQGTAPPTDLFPDPSSDDDKIGLVWFVGGGAVVLLLVVVIVAVVVVACVCCCRPKHTGPNVWDAPSDSSKPYSIIFVAHLGKAALEAKAPHTADRVSVALDEIVRQHARNTGCYVARRMDAHWMVAAKDPVRAFKFVAKYREAEQSLDWGSVWRTQASAAGGRSSEAGGGSPRSPRPISTPQMKSFVGGSARSPTSSVLLRTFTTAAAHARNFGGAGGGGGGIASASTSGVFTLGKTASQRTSGTAAPGSALIGSASGKVSSPNGPLPIGLPNPASRNASSRAVGGGVPGSFSLTSVQQEDSFVRSGGAGGVGGVSQSQSDLARHRSTGAMSGTVAGSPSTVGGGSTNASTSAFNTTQSGAANVVDATPKRLRAFMRPGGTGAPNVVIAVWHGLGTIVHDADHNSYAYGGLNFAKAAALADLGQGGQNLCAEDIIEDLEKFDRRGDRAVPGSFKLIGGQSLSIDMALVKAAVGRRKKPTPLDEELDEEDGTTDAGTLTSSRRQMNSARSTPAAAGPILTPAGSRYRVAFGGALASVGSGSLPHNSARPIGFTNAVTNTGTFRNVEKVDSHASLASMVSQSHDSHNNTPRQVLSGHNQNTQNQNPHNQNTQSQNDRQHNEAWGSMHASQHPGDSGASVPSPGAPSAVQAPAVTEVEAFERSSNSASAGVGLANYGTEVSGHIAPLSETDNGNGQENVSGGGGGGGGQSPASTGPANAGNSTAVTVSGPIVQFGATATSSSESPTNSGSRGGRRGVGHHGTNDASITNTTPTAASSHSGVPPRPPRLLSLSGMLSAGSSGGVTSPPVLETFQHIIHHFSVTNVPAVDIASLRSKAVASTPSSSSDMLSSYRSDTFSASDSLSEFDASSETSDNVVASLQEHKQIEGLAIRRAAVLAVRIEALVPTANVRDAVTMIADPTVREISALAKMHHAEIASVMDGYVIVTLNADPGKAVPQPMLKAVALAVDIVEVLGNGPLQVRAHVGLAATPSITGTVAKTKCLFGAAPGRAKFLAAACAAMYPEVAVLCSEYASAEATGRYLLQTVDLVQWPAEIRGPHLLSPFVAVMGAIEQEDQEDDEWLYQLDTAVADSPFTPVNRLFTQLIDGKAEAVMSQVANLPAIPPDVIGMPGAAIGTQRLKAMHVQFMHHKYAFINGPSQSQTQSGVALAGRGRGSVTFAMSQSSSEGVPGAALPIPDQHQQHQSSSSANSSHGSSGGPASGRKLSGGEHVSESTFTSSDAFAGQDTLPPSPAAGAGAGVTLNRPTEAGFTLPGVTEQAADEQSGGEQGRTPSTTARQSDPTTAAASSEEPAPPPGQSGPTARGKPPLIPTTSPRHQTGSGQGQGSGHPPTGAVEQSVPGHATAVSPGQAALSPRDMGRRFSAATVTSTAEDSPAVSPEHSSAQAPSAASPGLGPAGAGSDVVEWYAGQRMEQVVLAIARR